MDRPRRNACRPSNIGITSAIRDRFFSLGSLFLSSGASLSLSSPEYSRDAGRNWFDVGFAYESFERQQSTLNKSVEDHMGRLLVAVEDLGKKPPDGTVTVTTSKPRGWSLPRSVLVKPVGFDTDAWPKMKIEPPRFSGEGVNLWIKKVQKYYNHNFTSLADRLYLTEFLLDDEAAEWLYIKRRFDPDLYEDSVGRSSCCAATD
ncbi:hypothetical protein SASPL_115758 [Salvia splendens]|uniref:Uncharacterized protein n=1 Tax=Salvia splendens TaxID=180675 RepID=A0A8X8Y876_SALSN|nr:hypothetical protein SASPL_115758 [Salvia splendens]